MSTGVKKRYIASMVCALAVSALLYARLPRTQVQAAPLEAPKVYVNNTHLGFFQALTLANKPKEIPPANCDQVACIALTFDDGPGQTTAQLLNELNAEQAKATFFEVGSRIGTNTELVRRIYQDGHQLGNHSWNHPDFAKLNFEQMKQQVDATQQALTSAGVPAAIVFRPPYGVVKSVDFMQAVNMPVILWNIDPKDWAIKDPNQLRGLVVAQAHPGGIVILHDLHAVTADALPGILHDLKQQSYHFVTVSELLHIAPTDKGIFYGHPPH